MFGRNRRWSDYNKHFGPFTYSKSNEYRAYGLLVMSWDDSDDFDGSHISIMLGKHAFFCELPNILKPWREIHASYEPSELIWYETHRREYGFLIHPEYNWWFRIFFGAQTHSSTTTKSWSYTPPFTQWRFHRTSLYDLNGQEVWTLLEKDRDPKRYWDELNTATKKCPTKKFKFLDYDGEEIEVTTAIEEREWRFGEGWFKWLSWFRKPLVRRSLDLEFSKETGPRKGSWKGGTLGTGIDLFQGELHNDAFRRYCILNNMTYIGEIK